MSETMNREYLEMIFPLMKSLRLYHQHEVVGMQHIPKKGRALVVVNHSLATYDIALLGCAIYQERERIPRSLADRWFFKFSALGEITKRLGGVEGSHKNAETLLKKGELVTVAPGGMREALRPSTERYQILWEKRMGFAKLAMKTGTPIILAACPKADDIFDVFPNPLTKWAYKNFKIPLIFARGLGPTPLPRPVKLVHFLSPPIKPPKASEDPVQFEKQVADYHEKIVKKARELIGQAIAYRS